MNLEGTKVFRFQFFFLVKSKIRNIPKALPLCETSLTPRLCGRRNLPKIGASSCKELIKRKVTKRFALSREQLKRKSQLGICSDFPDLISLPVSYRCYCLFNLELPLKQFLI